MSGSCIRFAVCLQQVIRGQEGTIGTASSVHGCEREEEGADEGTSEEVMAVVLRVRAAPDCPGAVG